MKFLMKTDRCIILKQDFVIERYIGFMTESETNDEYKPITIPAKDKFMTRVMRSDKLTIMNEKFKELFSSFLIKFLGITGYNMMAVPIHDTLYGPVGCIIFVNKQIGKEKINFNTKDEQIADM